jgi:trk system potassium uptake protein TrkH
MRNPGSSKPGDRKYRVPRVKSWQVELPRVAKPKATASTPLVTLLYGFAAFIAVGAVLLMLPVSSNNGMWTSPVDALFTATSAVCVTGLVVVDTADYYSFFGQMVILILIQLGGLGFMASATLFLMALGRRIGLRERLLIKESMGVEYIGGLLKLVIRIVPFTFIAEGLGALVLSLRFAEQNPPGAAVWKGIFQSVSAFNNAGFDLHGGFRSLLNYQSDAVTLLTTAILFILGGISFTVVQDVITRRSFRRLSLDSKIVLITTGSLLVAGTFILLFAEFWNPNTLEPMPLPQKMLNAFFHAATPRTAGFASIDVSKMMTYSLFFTIFLMFIGGASGSTAGGVKVNTFGALMIILWNSVQGKEHPSAFGREFRTHDIYRVLTLIVLSLGIIVFGITILSITENFDFLKILFEVVSAFGTVGLTTGITPSLSIAGKLTIILVMYLGRLGPMTIALSLVQRQQPTMYRYAEEPIKIG